MNSFIDPGDYVVSNDGASYIMLNSVLDTRVHHVVYFVLEMFTQMGMTGEEFFLERRKLVTDEAYFSNWCRTLPDWCDDAFYIKKKIRIKYKR